MYLKNCEQQIGCTRRHVISPGRGLGRAKFVSLAPYRFLRHAVVIFVLGHFYEGVVFSDDSFCLLPKNGHLITGRYRYNLQ